MKKVCVFLSTYNGEKFLRPQIDSILAQENVRVVLYVRDDGSADSTREILREYEQRCENVIVTCGENIGYIRSFMWLAAHCRPEDDVYYAFSDQDDVWHPQKLFRAVEKLKETNGEKPAVYYSDLNVVDENENFIRKANTWEGSITKYKLAVFIGIRGCTMVYNAAMQKLLYRRRTGPISGHDTYVALIAYWLGEVVYDPWAGIHYRQTGGNLSITGVSRTDWFMKNLLFLKKRMTVRSNIHEKNAREVLRQYEKLYPEELSGLHEVADYRSSLKNRMRLLTDRRFKDFSLLINAFNDFLILAGKL